MTRKIGELKKLSGVARERSQVGAVHVKLALAFEKRKSMHSTNYHDTLITVSPDCPVTVASPPAKPETIAGQQYALLSAAPYKMTSDELLLAVENERKGPVDAATFFSTPKACLRASPLVKKHGYGLHHDAGGRVALIAMESADYKRLMAAENVEKRSGMRSSRT